MKKVACIMAAIAVAGLALTGCSKKADSSDKVIKIGIIQLVEHPALDKACKGFVDALAEAGRAGHTNDDLILQTQIHDNFLLIC